MAVFRMRNNGINFHDSNRTLRQLPEGLSNRVHPFFGTASQGRQLWYFLALHQNSKRVSRGYVPLIVTSRMTSYIPCARDGSQSTSPPIATMSSSMRCNVLAIVNSRTGAPTDPFLISIPEAPVEKSPETGLTPL